MHLAILTQYYPPETGAPQARLSSLAGTASAMGHRVTVLTSMPSYPKGRVHAGYSGILRRESADGAAIIRSYIYPTQRTALIPRMGNYLSFTASSIMAGSLLLTRPDVLMVESPPLFTGIAGYWLSRLKGARMVFNVSDLWPESAVRLEAVREGSAAHRISLSLEAFCYRKAWLVTGQSQGILDNVRRRFPLVSLYHLSNGAETGRFTVPANKQQKLLLADPEADCIAIYAGLHGLAQGLEHIVTAARRCREIAFALVGDGPQKEALIQQTAGMSNVRFPDAVPAREVPSLLAAADIVLVTLGVNLPGAVPSKLYEAMASAKPVVLMAEGEAADIVLRHRAGLVVPPGDAAGLAEALKTLRGNPALRRELGENGRQAVRLYFDRTDINRKFVSMLEERLKPGR